MAIAFDSSSPAIVTASAAGATTASFTPPAGSLLVVVTMSGGSSRTVTVSSSNGLTFTQRAIKNNLTNAGSVVISTAVVGSSVSMTVTTTWNTGSSNITKVWVITGQDPSNPIGTTFNGPGSAVTSTTWNPTLYNSTVNNSMMVFGGAWLDSTAPTLSSTDTEEHGTLSTGVGLIAVHKSAVTSPSGTSVSTSVTSSIAPAASWTGVALEVVPSQPVSPSGIGSAESFGTATITPGTATISPSGIASAQAFGTASISFLVTASGIGSGEAFGTAVVGVVMHPSGIGSGESFGIPFMIFSQTVSPSGIATSETFGSPSLQLGYPQSLAMVGILSAETFGYPTVQNLSVWVLSPNHIQETPAGRDILLLRYGIDRGISLVKAGGIWSEVRYPAQTELEEAQKYYLGGYKYLLTPEEASDLISQGFGSLLHLEPLPSYSGV